MKREWKKKRWLFWWHLYLSGTGIPYWGEGDGCMWKRSEREFHNLSLSLFRSLSLTLSPPQRIIRWCRDGRQAQAEDWLGSHSSGTSKPQALTVSIPQSDRETRFDVRREREREGERGRERERAMEWEQKATGEESETGGGYSIT